MIIAGGAGGVPRAPGGVLVARWREVPPHARHRRGGPRRARPPAPISRRGWLAAVALCVAAPFAARAADPLPSWSDAAPKKAIVAFVERVTAPGGRAFVSPADRIAVFDTDGTLWPEQPVVEVAFVAARLKALADRDPSLRTRQPFKAALNADQAW